MTVLRPAGDFDVTYERDVYLVRYGWQWWLLGFTILIVALAPYWANAYFISTFNQIAYTIIAVQGLNILTGYTGQISLGQAAFMLVGGYIGGLLIEHLGFSFFIALPLAGLGTGVFGLIFGLPSLRVKGFYLAMATLAAQFIIPWLSRHTFPEYLGGSEGSIPVSVPQIGGFLFDEPHEFLYISLAVLIITTIFASNIGRTRLGRAFVAIRDNDLAAELLGVDLFGYKLRAFFLAAVYAGIAGAMRTGLQRGVGTDFGYHLDESILFLGMLVVGGLGTNLGAYLGTISIILLEDGANLFGGALATMFPDQASSLLTSFRPIFFGLILMLFLIFEPRGMAHRWTLIKAAWRLRPFAR